MSQSASSACTEFAAAKVNLTLRVGAARADGYHPVDSVVVFADWGDELSFEPADDLQLFLSGDHAASLHGEGENLVLKAAYALRAAAEKPELGAHITLVKSLPVASGIGGGSADAAAALRGLNRLWDLDFSDRQLAEIATVIGADVPVCVYSRAMKMTGIGERVAPLIAWPSLVGVLVNPGIGVSTAAVFEAFDAGKPGALDRARAPVAGDVEAALEYLRGDRNDLEPPAHSLQPVIGQVLDQLRTLPAQRLVRMSGSGATCFALFQEMSDAKAAAEKLRNDNPDWIVQAVTFAGAV